tara:strand:+ start:568 stop:1368 length:801 start_codon:yes stop_codon:yes gene_type:complete
MIKRVNNITQLNKEEISNSFAIGLLTADYDDGATITSIAVTSTSIALKDGDKFTIVGQEFTVGADTAAASTAIAVDSVALSFPIQRRDRVEINKENLYLQYQRKTEGTIGGMPVTADSIGPITLDELGHYEITGVDPTYVKVLPRDFMINEDGAYEALEFKDSANSGLQVGDAAQEMVATVNIPYGTSATHAAVFGSNTSKVVEVYECNVNANGIGSSIGTGTTDGALIELSSPVASSSTNYLLILVKVTATSNRIYGGKVTLTQN